MLKIAHFAADEKFIEAAIDIFESAYPKQNTFYITTPKPWSFIKDKPFLQHLNKKRFFQLLFTHREELKKYDLIIFHSLPNILLLPMVMLKQNYVWLGWGFDYYARSFDSNLLTNPLVLPKTSKFTESIISERNVVEPRSGTLSFMLKSLSKSLLTSKMFYECAMRNLKVFSPVLPQEYDLVEKKYGLGKKTKYSPWNYGILEKHIIKNIKLDDIQSANSILLGNSATETNNHFEGLDIISNTASQRQIYLPLSYGNVEYAELVKGYIRSKPELINRCIVLDTFMPLDNYNAIINDCGFVIMNHVRQQALGNIVAMMYRGAKIFLREESILYYYFKSLNAHIYSVQELENDSSLLNDHLTQLQIEHNRIILQETWSESVILERTIKLVEAAIN